MPNRAAIRVPGTFARRGIAAIAALAAMGALASMGAMATLGTPAARATSAAGANPAAPGAPAGSPYRFSSSTPPAEYTMEVRVSPETRHLDVSGTVVVAAAAAARPEIEVQLSETMPALEVAVVAPAAVAGAARAAKRGGQGGQLVWTVTLPRPLPAGQPLTLRFHCAGGERTSFVFSLGPEGSFASGISTAWYPQLLSGDDSLRSRGRIHYVVPKGYVVAGGGTLLSSAAEQAQGSFLFDASRPGYFSFAAARFAVSRVAGKVPTALYLLHSRRNAPELVRRLSSIIDFLSSQFGPFPYGDLAIVETPHDPSLRAGFTGAEVGAIMLVDGEQLDGDFVLAFYAHELSHCWWGNLVHAPNYLDETMAQFGSLQAVEALEGEAAAERYRRTGYPDYAPLQCALGYLMLAGAGFDHALADLPDAHPLSHELADSKGMLVADMVSRLVGRTAFTGVLQGLIRQNAYGTVTWQDILAAAQRYTTSDLRAFSAAWLERRGAPTFTLRWSQTGDTVSGAVEQSPPWYIANLDLELRGRDGKVVTQALAVQGATTPFHVRTGQAVRDAVLDPHFHVLHWTPELRAAAQSLWPSWRETVEQWKAGLLQRSPRGPQRLTPSHPLQETRAAR
jgi:aminopeptidase N